MCVHRFVEDVRKMLDKLPIRQPIRCCAQDLSDLFSEERGENNIGGDNILLSC